MFSNYTNKMVYDYFQNELKHSSDNYVKYQTLCETIKKEGFNRRVSEKKIGILRKFMNDRIMYNYNRFYSLLSRANSYMRAIKCADGSYNVYPTVNFPNYTDMIIDYCFTNTVTLEEAINYYSNLLQTVVVKKKEELKKSKINTYRGDFHHMIIRAKAVYDATAEMASRTDLTEEERSFAEAALATITFDLNNMLHIADSNLTIEGIQTNLLHYGSPYTGYNLGLEQYDTVNDLYDEILKTEESLFTIAKKIWNQHEKTNGVCLIHKLTSGLVKSDEMSKICTSYYSDTIKSIVKYNGNTGYVYPIDFDLILSICDTDSGSWVIDQSRFIEQGLPAAWQLDDTRIFYETSYQSKLFSPEFMEKRLLNGNDFGEIVINNRGRKIKPICCFYTEQATEEEIARITKLAESQGLEARPLETTEKVKIA